MKYAILYDEFNIVPELCRIYAEASTAGAAETIDSDFSEVVCPFRDTKTAKVCVPKAELVKVNRHILRKLLEEPGYYKKIIELIIRDADNTFKVTENNLKGLDVTSAEASELWRIYREFSDLSKQQFVSGGVPMLLDVYEPLLTDHITQYVKERISDPSKANDVVTVIITPEGKTSIAQEETDFLKLCAKISENEGAVAFIKKRPTLADFMTQYPEGHALLSAHHAEYHWIPHDFLGHVWDMQFFYDKLLEVLCGNETPVEILDRMERKHKDTEVLKKKYIDEINPDQAHANLIWFAQMSMYTKPYRKERFTHGWYYIYNILREICRRYEYALDETRWLLHDELRALLLDGIKVDKEILHKRAKGCVMVTRKGKTHIVYGEAAKAIEKEVESFSVESDATLLKGVCACKGHVKGTVKVIVYPSDMEKMKEGDILVSPATNPDIVPAMKKAGAIVTDQGGVTSHAAIVSREMGTPCVIGTKVASSILKDGDLVEVDADKGVVKIHR